MTTLYAINEMVVKCGLTLIINFTDEPMTVFDWKTVIRAQVRCSELYKDYPCATTFIKKEPLVYNVICGKMNTGEK